VRGQGLFGVHGLEPPDVDRQAVISDDWANDPVRRFSEKQFIGLVLGV